MLTVIASILVALLLLMVGYVDRDEAGAVSWSGRVWTLLGLAIACGWVAAGSAMWADPDRLREGQAYWALAIPLFSIGYIGICLGVLLAWWVLRWLLKRGWVVALVIAAAAWPVLGIWGAAAMLAACLAADRVFATQRRTEGG